MIPRRIREVLSELTHRTIGSLTWLLQDAELASACSGAPAVSCSHRRSRTSASSRHATWWLGSPGTARVADRCARDRAGRTGSADENGQPVGRLMRLGGVAVNRHEVLPSRGIQARDRLQKTPRIWVLGRRTGAPRGPSRRSAGVHHRDVVGHLRDHAEVVRDDHDRHPQLRAAGVPSARGSAPERSRRAPSSAHSAISSLGSFASAIAIIARWRIPPRTHAGTHHRAARGRGSDEAEQLDRAHTRLRLGDVAMARTSVHEDRAPRYRRVHEDSGSWKIIAMSFASDRAQPLFASVTDSWPSNRIAPRCAPRRR